MDEQRVVSARGVADASAAEVFEQIADPARQPAWDGNHNLAEAAPGQRVHAVGEVFVMHNAGGKVRHNHVVEFEEGRLIAWRPAEEGRPPFGQLWRWQLTPLDAGRTEVVHTYDWTELDDETRFERARSTTSEKLQASVDRLAALLAGRAGA